MTTATREQKLHADLVRELAAVVREMLRFQRSEDQDLETLSDAKLGDVGRWSAWAAKRDQDVRDKARALLARVLVEGPR